MYFRISKACNIRTSHTFAVLSMDDEHSSEPREDIVQLVTVLAWPTTKHNS